MPAPKDPTRLKRAKSGPLKMECFACLPAPGSSRPAIYATRGQVAEHGAAACPECSAPFLFCDVDVCEAIQLEELERHPVYRDRCTRELAAADVHAREHLHPDLVCGSCEAPAPRGSNPAEWYCGACQWVNVELADGTRGGSRLKSGTGSWEAAHYRETRADRPELERIHYPRNRRPEIVPARSWREALELRGDSHDAPASTPDLPF